MRARGIKPKTANRYREIVSALVNWAATQRGICLPDDDFSIIEAFFH